MAKPQKRRVQGGRVTPKGGAPRARSSAPPPEANTRYTPPVPRAEKVSPMWVPILMFVLLGAGSLIILINYTDAVWDTTNLALMIGLILILAGIVTATQYH